MKQMKNIQEKMDQMIKEMGLEEEFAELSNIFMDQFMVAGEETEELGEALHRADETLIDMLWESVEEKEESENAKNPVSREEKEKILAVDIPELFDSEFCYMSSEELTALGKAMTYQALSAEDMMILTGDPVKKGYVFIFINDGSCTVVVMRQIADIVRTKIQDEKIQLEIAFVQIIRILLRAALNLYGVFEKKQISEMFQRIVAEKEKDRDTLQKLLEGNVDTVIEVLEEKEQYWIDGEYIVDNRLKDKNAHKRLLRKRERKEYYMPSSLDEAETWGKELVNRENANYRGMLNILGKSLNDKRMAEMLMEELEFLVTAEDYRLADIMNRLYSYVEFDNEVAGRNFTIHCVKWLHTVKRWSNAGYSNEELGLPNEDEGKEWGGKTQEKMMKVQRNDPCPCGSGKKYKKCCMGKN